MVANRMRAVGNDKLGEPTSCPRAAKGRAARFQDLPDRVSRRGCWQACTVLRQRWPPARGKTRARGFSAATSPAPEGDAQLFSRRTRKHTDNGGHVHRLEEHILWAETCKMMQAPQLGIPASS